MTVGYVLPHDDFKSKYFNMANRGKILQIVTVHSGVKLPVKL